MQVGLTGALYRNARQDTLEVLRAAGVPKVKANKIKMGQTIGEGAFGTVKLARVSFRGIIKGAREACYVFCLASARITGPLVGGTSAGR